MPNADDLLDGVVDVIAPHARAPRDRIRPEGRLIDFGIDSVRAQQIVVDLEAKYGFEVPDRDVVDLESVGEIVAYVRRRLAEG